MKDLELEVCGGCNAKIPAGSLDEILKTIPLLKRPDVLVGFDSKDDAAVIEISEDIAAILTLDFFPSMVRDPYIFGQIAAANALSDIYAMGGNPVCGLNIVAFPEEGDVKVLEEILRGGAEKVKEAGATLVGGHSIHDPKVKYGLSVLGTVNPKKIWQNNTPKEGDLLILTKALGVTLITNGYSVGIVGDQEFNKALESMTFLNKYAKDIFSNYQVSSATDVTGFGFLGHLGEIIAGNFTAVIEADKLPLLDGARKCAEEFVFTKGAQRNRSFMEDRVEFQVEDFALEEVLYDPQTSGGLLVSLSPDQAEEALEDLKKANIPASIVGQIHKRFDKDIIII
ncbi:MAG: selenide, water dikinase SelD [Bacillota bacterium]|nr:selenide, water dikinase SelD [Bacillota bacterium]